MTIVAGGGGSGGHVTPLLAVLQELKRHDPNLKAYVVTDRKFAGAAGEIIAKAGFKVDLKKIYAGKLRRYHNIGFIKQFLHLPTTARNFRDFFLVGIGVWQSMRFLKKIRPDVVFLKGGFVCLPLGWAAKRLKIPIVIHDSDAHAGLANRILAKYAQVIGTGAPLENYNYPKGRAHYVGIPVPREFKPASPAAQRQAKAKLGIKDTSKPLVVVTGGGLGARSLNRAVVKIAPHLLDKVAFVHYSGTAYHQEAARDAPKHPDYILQPFTPSLALPFAAADIVVARAGASTMSELAAMAKAVIVVPNQHLAGGHQLKNAAVFKKAGAAVILDEEKIVLDSRVLAKAIAALAASPQHRKQLGERLHHFARPDAALDMAALIAETAYAKQGGRKKTA